MMKRFSQKHLIVSRSFSVAMLCVLGFFLQAANSLSAQVVATVNGEKIDRDRLHLYLLTQGVAEPNWEQVEKKQLEQLIDRTLVRQFLKSRKMTAPQSKLDRQLGLIEKVLSDVESPEKVLKQMGMTRKDLAKELSLSLAWKRYVQQVITEQEIAEFFENHRSELDGTRRQARQIYLKLSSDATEEQSVAVMNQLSDWKNRIERGEISFEVAAQKHSQAPSSKQGGDLGTFAFTGQMPVEIVKQVFETKVGKMSEPFRTRYGAHLIYVEREIPGLFSLEDARAEILSKLIEIKWQQNVKRLRKSARISYASE